MHDGGILKRKKKPTAPSALTWTNQHAQHDGAPRLFCFIKRWKAGPYTQLSAVSSKNSSTQAVYGYICQLHRERDKSVSNSLLSLHIWDWFAMAGKCVDCLTGHCDCMLVLTSEPSRLDTNACTDSSSSFPLLISISFRTLWIMGREKGGMVRRTPLEEKKTRSEILMTSNR